MTIATALRVLIVGGYGVFGGRLAQLLADEQRLTLVIAGRSIAKAEAFCAKLEARATLVPAAFDRDGDLAAQLALLAPDVVVDASGPFQDYGADAYRLVAAAIAARIPYLDLADGSAFVEGIAAFDAQAKTADVFALAGASSFPVLTAAVVKRLAAPMAEVATITGGIAPSPYAGVGLNVIRAIVSYAGRPVALHRDGRPATGAGLAETRRYTICPPGALPLRNTLFSLVDVPDLRELPRQWPSLRAIWMGAGPVPEILHAALVGLARGVRLGLLPRLTPLSRLFHRVINTLRWGEHRGGMFVAVEGRAPDGAPLARSWHMLAEGDHGPLIPSMAVELIIRNWLRGQRPANGARSAAGALTLDDYDRGFASRTIVSGIRDDHEPNSSACLYRRILGDAWLRLPAPIRAMHEFDGERVAKGHADIERGTHPLARLAAALFGFPPAGRDVPVTVRFTVRDGRETWQRNFGGRGFASSQTAGTGRSQHLIDERFGPFAFGLAIVADEAGLALVVRRWTMLGVPLPLALAPRSNSRETVVNGRFAFDVEIVLPFVGRMVRYRGTLTPDEVANAVAQNPT